jgi:hypothetical protein
VQQSERSVEIDSYGCGARDFHVHPTETFFLRRVRMLLFGIREESECKCPGGEQQKLEGIHDGTSG